MSEEYVSKTEFNSLKSEVQELKVNREDDSRLLIAIDKKIDIIAERINNESKTDELKLQQLEERVNKLEENNGWLVKTVGATIIGMLFKLIFDISNYVK